MSTATTKLSAIVTTLLLVAITSYPAFAVGPTPEEYSRIIPLNNSATTGAETRKQKREERLDIKKEKAEKRIETMKEKLSSREAALKAKLEEFKDQRKAQITDRVNTNLNMINQKRTEQMRKHLASMSEILDRLETRVSQGSPDIKDISLAKTAVAAARETIATVSAAVQTQAEKDYTIQITSETRVRTDAKTQRDKLHRDLLDLRKKVIVAKQAVGSAIKVAKGQKGETVSGKQ